MVGRDFEGLNGLDPAKAVAAASSPPHLPALFVSLPWDSLSVEEQHETRRAPGSRRKRIQSMYVRKRMMRQAIKLQKGSSNCALQRMWDGDKAAISTQSSAL